MDNKKSKFQDLVFIGLIYTLSIIIFLSANSFPKAEMEVGYGAGMFPMLLAAIMFLLSTVLLLRIIVSIINNKPAKNAELDDNQKQINELENKKRKPLEVFKGFIMSKPALYMVSVLFFAVFTEWLGFVICASIMVFAMTIIMGSNPKTSIIVSVGAAVTVFVLFKIVLKVPLPIGQVFGG